MAKEILNLEVKSNIESVTKETDDLGKSVGKASDETRGLGTGLATAGTAGSRGFKTITAAVYGLGVALKAIGIGLVLAAFATFKQLIEENQKVLDFFNTSFKVASLMFRDLFTYLENNIGSYITYMKEMFEDPVPMIETMALTIRDKFIQSLISLNTFIVQVSKSLLAFMEMRFKDAVVEMDLAALSLLDAFLGVDSAAKKIKTQFTTGADKLKEYTTSIWETAAGMTELENKALLAEVQFAKLNAEFLRDAEIQRQIRDDVSKTFAVRIAANEELSKILAKQAIQQKAQLQIQLDSAQAAFDLNDSIENKIALGQAEVAMLELKETIEGQISEQLTNQTTLEEELRVAKEQTLAEGMSGMERELEELKNSYEEKKRLAIKAGMETAAITEQYEKEKAEIIKTATEGIEDFKKDLQMKAFKALGSHIDASMSELEGRYSREKRLAEANGQSTAAIDKKYEGERKKLAQQQKTFKVAEALITTYQMASLAYKDGLEAGGPAGLILGPIAAGVAVVAGLANVRSIMAQDVGGGGGGGGGGGVNGTTPAPQMMSGAFELTGGEPLEPTRAYVVSDDITNNQNKLAIIRRRATI